MKQVKKNNRQMSMESYTRINNHILDECSLVDTLIGGFKNLLPE